MDTNERFLGVLDYRPQHVHTVAELGSHRARLRAIVGSTFRSALACWDNTDDEWFTDGPLILQFDHAQLELAAFQVHMCVSWDQIDVHRTIEWSPESTFQLTWKEDALAPLEALRGHAIDELTVIEYRGGFNGLGFRAGNAYAEIYNALDELGIRGAVDDDSEVARSPA